MPVSLPYGKNTVSIISLLGNALDAGYATRGPRPGAGLPAIMLSDDTYPFNLSFASGALSMTSPVTGFVYCLPSLLPSNIQFDNASPPGKKNISSPVISST